MFTVLTVFNAPHMKRRIICKNNWVYLTPGKIVLQYISTVFKVMSNTMLLLASVVYMLRVLHVYVCLILLVVVCCLYALIGFRSKDR